MDFASHSRRRRTFAGTLPLRSLHRRRLCTGGPVAEFPVMHLRRRSSEWVAFKLKVTAIGVELLDRQSRDLWWSLDFRDMDNPAIILLADNTGNRSTENSGFILCHLYGRKCKAFVVGIGASNSTIISHVTKTARSTVGLSLSVDTSQSLIIIDFIKRRGCYCSAVSALVRFAEEPQMFAIEFNDGCPIHVYTSTSRDNLLAAVRDVLQTEGQWPVPVLTRLTSILSLTWRVCLCI